MLKVDF